jgi:hypothetical protein
MNKIIKLSKFIPVFCFLLLLAGCVAKKVAVEPIKSSGTSGEFNITADDLRNIIFSIDSIACLNNSRCSSSVTPGTSGHINFDLTMAEGSFKGLSSDCVIEIFSAVPSIYGRTGVNIRCFKDMMFVGDYINNEKSILAAITKSVAKMNLDKAAAVSPVSVKEQGAETAKTQKQAVKPPATQSEIDKPEIAASERIMGNNDLAVIIGIEGYSNLPKSEYSYDDARLVKEYAKALGFRERNIEMITDEKATKTTIEKSLEVWLRNKAKSDSRVLVYYSGHGAPDPATGESYIVPYDGDPSYLSVTGYPLKRLYEKLGSLPTAEVIVVLDACFSGAGGRSVLAKGARPLVMTTTTAVSYPNMAVLSATQGAQISTSSPERGHGVFTYYFLKALKEGKTNIADIYESIKPQIEDEAKQINVQQSPSINPDVEKVRGRFALRR